FAIELVLRFYPLQLLLQLAPRPLSRLLQLAVQPADILVRVWRQCAYALQLALKLNDPLRSFARRLFQHAILQFQHRNPFTEHWGHKCSAKFWEGAVRLRLNVSWNSASVKARERARLPSPHAMPASLAVAACNYHSAPGRQGCA